MYSFLRQIPQCDSQLCAIILQRRKFGEGRGRGNVRSAASCWPTSSGPQSVRRPQYGMVWCTVLVTIWAPFAGICRADGRVSYFYLHNRAHLHANPI